MAPHGDNKALEYGHFPERYRIRAKQHAAQLLTIENVALAFPENVRRFTIGTYGDDDMIGIGGFDVLKGGGVTQLNVDGQLTHFICQVFYEPTVWFVRQGSDTSGTSKILLTLP